jgi:Holliday junction resolvase RusA-like endonuclease
MKYRAFADECREQGMEIVNGAVVIFYIPMPKSWSKRKKAQMIGKGHQQKPDVDNLLKAVMDATLKEDCHIYDIHPKKFWAEQGRIQII